MLAARSRTDRVRSFAGLDHHVDRVPAVAGELGRILDHAAGIREEVGDVKRAAGVEGVGDRVVDQWVVRARRDHPAAPAVDVRRGDHLADGARGEDVHLRQQRLLDAGRPAADLLGDGGEPALVHVGQQERRAVRVQQPGEARSDAAHADDRHPLASQACVAPHDASRRLHRADDRACGRRRGVA